MGKPEPMTVLANEIKRLKRENAVRWETERVLRKVIASLVGNRSLPVLGQIVDGGKVEWKGEQP